MSYYKCVLKSPDPRRVPIALKDIEYNDYLKGNDLGAHLLPLRDESSSDECVQDLDIALYVC